MICHIFILPFVVNSAKNLSEGALNIIYVTPPYKHKKLGGKIEKENGVGYF